MPVLALCEPIARMGAGDDWCPRRQPMSVRHSSRRRLKRRWTAIIIAVIVLAALYAGYVILSSGGPDG